MKKLLLVNFVSLLLIVIFAGCETLTKKEKAGAVKVELKNTGGRHQLFVDGRPFYIKGAGLADGNIEALALTGGNSFRTWSTSSKTKTGKEILDEAHKYGLMVCMGIDIARERHGFDYNDSVSVSEQFNRVKSEVVKYKDHPALLCWGIGNELNLNYTNPSVWDAVNEIAAMIHEIDPNHPVTTMFAGAAKKEVEYIMERCPQIDFLSFQIYGDIMNLPKYIKESGWQGAYIVSEWGTKGHWEVATTSWGRPIEPNSHERALDCINWYENVIASDKNQCIGSYVFLWGQKQERTPTWYGLWLEDGSSTEAVDAMYFLWNNKWPENRAPGLDYFTLNGQKATDNVFLAPGKTYSAKVTVTEPDGDSVNYRWEILAEVPENQQSEGGDYEKKPITVFNQEYGMEGDNLEFVAPSEEGAYRIFIYASDRGNKTATANIPFYVKQPQAILFSAANFSQIEFFDE